MLNYTTKVPAHQSIAEISQILAKGGARAVMHEYDDAGQVRAINFSMVFNGREIGFKLPASVDAINQIIIGLQKADPRHVPKAYISRDHAINVTWRVIKDWIEAQVAMIEANQVRIEQVFLPYAVTKDGQTLYEHIAADPTLLLGPGGQ
jgi:hypothetical protein